MKGNMQGRNQVQKLIGREISLFVSILYDYHSLKIKRKATGKVLKYLNFFVKTLKLF
jgi:hypothetical protein